MGRRRKPTDDLTAREREVLALLQDNLSNGLIADRLGVSQETVKHHVSEILSKLGVSSREEAAAWSTGEQRGWLAALARWALAGAAGAVVVAVGVLVWGTVTAGGPVAEHPSTVSLTPEALYQRVREAITRPGFVLHTTVVMRVREQSGASPAELGTLDYWIDPQKEAYRVEFESAGGGPAPEGSPRLCIRQRCYVRQESGEVTVEDISAVGQEEFCPGTSDLWVSFVLWCGATTDAQDGGGQETSVEAEGVYAGVPAIEFRIEEWSVTQLGGYELPRITNGPQPTPVPAMTEETRNLYTTYLSVDTYLPLARVSEIRVDGEFHDSSEITFTHEYVAADDLPLGLFDPLSIGNPED